MGTALLHNRVINKNVGLPDYTYSGEHALAEEDGGWKIRFLTSGTLKMNKKTTVDIFCVGGGGGGGKSNYGGGGGGGYTTTEKNVELVAGAEYVVTVGLGGNASMNLTNVATDGGQSSFADIAAADGGLKGNGSNGGAGGSGGGGGSNGSTGVSGGSDGSDGSSRTGAGGAGQGTTTREFGEENGTLYAGGGGGGAMSNGTPGAGGAGGGGAGGTGNNPAAQNGEPNTGGGGGGARSTASGAGGSGIVIIRNARG